MRMTNKLLTVSSRVQISYEKKNHKSMTNFSSTTATDRDEAKPPYLNQLKSKVDG